MAEGDVIKEFLIGLGVKADAAGLRSLRDSIGDIQRAAEALVSGLNRMIAGLEKSESAAGSAARGARAFATGVGEAAKQVAGMGAVVFAAGGILTAYVKSTTSYLDQLYWVGQRTRNSTTDLLAYTHAMRSAGFAQGDALGALESFSQALENPGVRSLLRGQMGISVSGFGAGPEQLYKTVEGLARIYAQGGANMAVSLQYAEQYGIPASMIRQAANDPAKWARDRLEEGRRYEDLLRRFGFTNKSLEDSLNRMRVAESGVALAFTAIRIRIMEDFGPAIIKAEEWILAILTSFGEWDKKMSGWPSTLAAIAVALLATGAALRFLGFSLAGVRALMSGWLLVVGSLGLAAWELFHHWDGAMAYLGPRLEEIRTAFENNIGAGLIKTLSISGAGIIDALYTVARDLTGKDAQLPWQQAGETFGEAFVRGFKAAIKGIFNPPDEHGVTAGERFMRWLENYTGMWDDKKAEERARRRGEAPATPDTVEPRAHRPVGSNSPRVRAGRVSFSPDGGDGGESVADLLTAMMHAFAQWWSGSTAYRPIVVVAQEYYEKLGDALREFALSLGYKPVGPGGSASGGGLWGRVKNALGLGGGGGSQVGPGALTIGQLKQAALTAGWPEGEAAQIAAIAMAESSGDPYATGSAGEQGVTQILPGADGAHRFAAEARGNPVRAMQLALQLRQDRGWRQWSVYKNQRYLQHMDAAQRAAPEALPGVNVGMDPMAPAGSSAISSGLAKIRSAAGRQFTVASQFAVNFLGFINDYEKAGGIIGPESGGLSTRPGNASYHPLGRAIDINQIGRNIRSRLGLTLPVGVENALAEDWGLYPGSLFKRPDAGHFEVRNAAAALAAVNRHRLGSSLAGARGSVVNAPTNTTVTINGATDPNQTADAVHGVLVRHAGPHANHRIRHLRPGLT